MTIQGNESQVRVDSLATFLLSNGGHHDALQKIKKKNSTSFTDNQKYW